MPVADAPVSVIIPCFRCVKTIGRALESVYAQSWRPVEVIAIDDNSGDNTVPHLQALQRRYPAGWLRVVELPSNVGPGGARNVGWDTASQRYVAFLDADDAWHPKKVEIQVGWMESNPQVALAGHACPVVDEGKANIVDSASLERASFKKVSAFELLLKNRFPTVGIVLKRDLPYRFSDSKRYCEDYLLWCEICVGGHACYRSAAPLAYLFKAEYGVSGLSRNLWLMEKGELDCYAQLQQSGRIGVCVGILLRSASLARYVRRIIKVCLRKLGGG